MAGETYNEIVYKAAEGKAIAGSCCGGRERTEAVEEGPKDLPSFGTESFTNAGSITPNSIVTIVFGFITVIFMMIGAAIALHLIHRDYDYGLRSASNTVTWPRPSQDGQAPAGELNEKRRGSSSPSE